MADNGAIMQRYLEEVWVGGNLGYIDEVVAPDAVFHDLIDEPGVPPGREGIKVMVQRLRAGFPDFTFEWHDMVVQDDLVYFRWVSAGTHVGDFNGLPATGRTVSMTGMVLARLEDGRMVEGWQEADRLGMAQELGMVPRGSMPRPVATAMSFAIRTRDRLTRRRPRGTA